MVRILLVEDEILLSMAAEILLEQAGHHVTIAADGVEALRIVREERPDLIIADYMMPRMNGVEMIQNLRDAGCRIPIGLVTAVPKNQLPEGSYGYDLYLEKPYMEQDLLTFVERLAAMIES